MQELGSGPALLLGAGLVVVALATLTGAWLGGGRAGRRQIWFGAAAGALLVIAVLHLLPDAWSGARAAGIPVWEVPLVAVVGFGLAVAVGRAGCACEADREHVGGSGTAAALAVHRFLEGAALALTGPVTAAALSVHAVGEGMAVGALLHDRPRGRAVWLGVMCAGPIPGALVVAAVPALAAIEPFLLALAAGVLAQAARISLRAAFPGRLSVRWLAQAPALALVVTASLTAAAVHLT